MTLDDNKKIQALISFFQSLVQKKTKKKPIINRNKVKYHILDMMQDLSVSEIKALMEAYVLRSLDPDIVKFCYNYDEIALEVARDDEDLKRRKELLEQTRRRVEEYRRETKID